MTRAEVPSPDEVTKEAGQTSTENEKDRKFIHDLMQAILEVDFKVETPDLQSKLIERVNRILGNLNRPELSGQERQNIGNFIRIRARENDQVRGGPRLIDSNGLGQDIRVMVMNR